MAVGMGFPRLAATRLLEGERVAGPLIAFSLARSAGCGSPRVHHLAVQPMKILPEGSIEILERIEDPVTDLLEKTPLDHSDVAFPRALVPGLVGPGRQHRKAHVIGKVTVGGIYIGVPRSARWTPLLRLSTTT